MPLRERAEWLKPDTKEHIYIKLDVSLAWLFFEEGEWKGLEGLGELEIFSSHSRKPFLEEFPRSPALELPVFIAEGGFNSWSGN